MSKSPFDSTRREQRRARIAAATARDHEGEVPRTEREERSLTPFAAEREQYGEWNPVRVLSVFTALIIVAILLLGFGEYRLANRHTTCVLVTESGLPLRYATLNQYNVAETLGNARVVCVTK